jgi:hypothetical protein
LIGSKRTNAKYKCIERGDVPTDPWRRGFRRLRLVYQEIRIKHEGGKKNSTTVSCPWWESNPHLVNGKGWIFILCRRECVRFTGDQAVRLMTAMPQKQRGNFRAQISVELECVSLNSITLRKSLPFHLNLRAICTVGLSRFCSASEMKPTCRRRVFLLPIYVNPTAKRLFFLSKESIEGSNRKSADAVVHATLKSK